MKASGSLSSPEASPKSLNKSGQFISLEQPSLFTHMETPEPGSVNDGNFVRSAITESIRRSTKSREEVAEEITALVGERVTVRMLNSYTSEAAGQHRWPLQYTRAFCFVVSDWTLLSVLAERSGLFLITPSEKELLSLGAEYLKQKRAAEQIAKLEKRLGGIEL